MGVMGDMGIMGLMGRLVLQKAFDGELAEV